jgi:Methyltransferase FkbM domain
MPSPAVTWVKRRVLPSEPRLLRLPLGVPSGIRLEIDFEKQTKLWLGLYETELNNHLQRLCRPGARCFDVGGNVGFDALVLAKLSGRPVISFEADPEITERLRRNVTANPSLSVDVRCAYVGAASEDGVVAIDDVAFTGGGFVPDFIKIDVDGGEEDVLRGAERVLRERRPDVIVETHSPELEESCAEILCAAGYSPLVVSQRRWLRDYRPTEHNRWLVAESPR